MDLLAAAEGELHLRLSAGEVQLERHEGQAFLLDGPDQALDLLAVQQQLAGPHGVVIPGAALLVWRDVHPLQPDLAAPDAAEGLLDGRLAAPERLDLGSGEDDARLPGVEDVIVVRGPRIPGDGMTAFSRVGGGGLRAHNRLVTRR